MSANSISTGMQKTKLFIVGGIALVVLTIVTVAIIKWRKKVNAEKYDITDANNELDKIKVNGGNTTITNGDSILIAQNLLGAMNRNGTDEKAIFDNLALCKNADDLKLVIKTFGMKLYTGSALADTWASRQIATLLNLNGWLRAELSGADLAEAERIFKHNGLTL